MNDFFVEFVKEDSSRVSIHVDQIFAIEELADRTLIECYGNHEYLVLDPYNDCLAKIDKLYSGDHDDSESD